MTRRELDQCRRELDMPHPERWVSDWARKLLAAAEEAAELQRRVDQLKEGR